MVTLLPLSSAANTFNGDTSNQPHGCTLPSSFFKLPLHLCPEDYRDAEMKKRVTDIDVKKGWDETTVGEEQVWIKELTTFLAKEYFLLWLLLLSSAGPSH